MRVCLIPDCGEQRTREIMDQIQLLVEKSQSMCICMLKTQFHFLSYIITTFMLITIVGCGTYLNYSEPKGMLTCYCDSPVYIIQLRHCIKSGVAITTVKGGIHTLF